MKKTALTKLEMKIKRPFQLPFVPPPRNQWMFSYPKGAVDIEIGSGNGYFAMNYCQSNPDRFLIAIEKTKTRFSRFQNRLHLCKSMPNLLPLADNAIRWIPYHIHPESIDRYFILFPNPYPKDRQWNKRWALMPFMGFLLQTLKPGGTLFLATNIRNYMSEAKEAFENIWHLQTIFFQSLNSKERPGPASQFEIKYLAKGQTTFHAIFQKPPPMPGPVILKCPIQ